MFTYAEQLTNIAHREQVEVVIDLDDIAEVSMTPFDRVLSKRGPHSQVAFI